MVAPTYRDVEVAPVRPDATTAVPVIVFDCEIAAALSRLIAGVVPPDEATGAVAVTLVTPAPAGPLIIVVAPV